MEVVYCRGLLVKWPHPTENLRPNWNRIVVVGEMLDSRRLLPKRIKTISAHSPASWFVGSTAGHHAKPELPRSLGKQVVTCNATASKFRPEVLVWWLN